MVIKRVQLKFPPKSLEFVAYPDYYVNNQSINKHTINTRKSSYTHTQSLYKQIIRDYHVERNRIIDESMIDDKIKINRLWI